MLRNLVFLSNWNVLILTDHTCGRIIFVTPNLKMSYSDIKGFYQTITLQIITKLTDMPITGYNCILSLVTMVTGG